MIDLKLLRSQCSISFRDDDALLAAHLEGAIEAAEHYTESHIKQVDTVAYFDAFEPVMRLKGPVVSVEKIVYVDQNGEEQELYESSVYEVKPGRMGGVYLAYSQAWPAARVQARSIRVHYRAGYTRDTLPASLRLALMSLTAHFYENREVLAATQLYEVPVSYKFLLSKFCEG